MTLYQNDNFAAFEELHSRYTSRVYSYLRKRLNSNEAVEDLYQKVFLKLHENRAKFDNKLLFAPWLFTMTRNVLIDWYRVKKDLPTEKIEHLVDQAENTVTNDEPDLDIKEIIEKLPENYKQAIELRYIEDLDFDEIARRMNVKESNVRKIVSRGVTRLRQLALGVRK